MARSRRRGKILAALAALVLVASGCSLLRGAVSTIRALDRAGFGAADIQPGTGTDSWQVTVEKKDAEDLDAAAADAAAVVWRELPLRIARLEVRCGNGFGGKGTFSADRAELERRFGPRPATLDEGIQDGDVRTIAVVLAGLIVLGVVVLVGIVVLVVLLIRRSRKRNPPPGPWGTQPPPPGYGPSA